MVLFIDGSSNSDTHSSCRPFVSSFLFVNKYYRAVLLVAHRSFLIDQIYVLSAFTVIDVLELNTSHTFWLFSLLGFVFLILGFLETCSHRRIAGLIPSPASG